MKRLLFATLLLGTCTLPSLADEGMWMLTDLKKQNAAAMLDLGLLIPVDSIYNPYTISIKDAVVHFGSGCTAEVISPEGLVLTNHHCGYGSIQKLSSVEHDYLTDGFWAMNRQQELPVQGLTITYIDRILDVTDYVMAQLKKDPDPNGTNYLSASYLRTVAARFAKAEQIADAPGQSLELKAFYGGNRYYLFVKTTYSDIRLVGAPPSSIGKFGADTDNWMWPRQTGDFSIFRIYADANGKPVPYAADNVPLRVKKYVTLNIGGIQEGDFAFVMGFPGRNWRNMISDEVEERMQTTNFMRHYVRDVRQKVLMDEMQSDPAIRIHYASIYASSANYWKNAIGMNEGLVKLNILDVKREQQEKLLAMGRAEGTNIYQQAFDTIRHIVQVRRQAMYHQQALQESFETGMRFMNFPNLNPLLKAIQSKNKKDIKAEKEKLEKLAATYFANNPFPEVEKKVAKAMMKTYAKYIPADQRISIYTVIDQRFGGDTDAFVDACFGSSIFGSADNFKRFIRKPKAKYIEQDWMMLFKQSITGGLMQTALQMSDANKSYNAAHKVWVSGMMKLKQQEGLPIYPDANSTLRLTYGKVCSYDQADAIEFEHYTTLKGVMQKEDSTNFEFVVPAKLKELYRTGDFGRYAMPNGEMPVCFIVSTDNTGGNSGSPVFNAKGQLIGTAFDRNYEGLTGDIAYRPASQRAACVDIRYTLFIIDKYAGAGHLLKEMTIVSER